MFYLSRKCHFCVMNWRYFFILFFVYRCETRSIVRRPHRSCNVSAVDDDDDQAFYRTTIFENPVYLTLMVTLSVFFILLFLGFVKGIIGLVFSKKVGMFGLNLLIDLPRRIYEYDESNLRHRCIIYDVGGWPIHPDTKERTVRVVPKGFTIFRKTEFCLNLVFFLAYPLSVMITLCSMCCCLETITDTRDECTRLNTTKDVYKDDDIKEQQDTKYVINILRQSRLNLNLPPKEKDKDKDKDKKKDKQ